MGVPAPAPGPPRTPDGSGRGTALSEREPSPRMRAVYLLAPIVLTAMLYAFTWIVAPTRVAAELVIAGTATLAIGTPVILGAAALGDGAIQTLSTWDLWGIVTYATVASAFFFSHNFDLLQRVPWLGPRLRSARTAAAHTLVERPWIRRWATVGVAAFVVLPLPGSGSLGGSIVGRLIGLSRMRTFLTVSIAGVVVCLGYAWFGAGIDAWAKAHAISFPVRIASVVASLVVLWLLARWLNRLTRSASPPSPGS